MFIASIFCLKIRIFIYLALNNFRVVPEFCDEITTMIIRKLDLTIVVHKIIFCFQKNLSVIFMIRGLETQL